MRSATAVLRALGPCGGRWVRRWGVRRLSRGRAPLGFADVPSPGRWVPAPRSQCCGPLFTAPFPRGDSGKSRRPPLSCPCAGLGAAAGRAGPFVRSALREHLAALLLSPPLFLPFPFPPAAPESLPLRSMGREIKRCSGSQMERRAVNGSSARNAPRRLNFLPQISAFCCVSLSRAMQPGVRRGVA